MKKSLIINSVAPWGLIKGNTIQWDEKIGSKRRISRGAFPIFFPICFLTTHRRFQAKFTVDLRLLDDVSVIFVSALERLYLNFMENRPGISARVI